MVKYILKRLVYSVLTLWALITLTFFMMRAMPGDPFLGEKTVPDSVRAALTEKFGLDKPTSEQYVIYLKNILKGDLGTSIKYKRPVTDIILEAFPNSFELGVRSLIFAVIMGIMLGVIAAVRRGTRWDTGAMIIAILGVSIPSFIVGSLLQYFLAYKIFAVTGLKIFPVTGWSGFSSKILPAFALSFGSMATISRLMRTSMLDVLSQDYIKTAKAKGLSEKAMVWRHAIRNAIMPVITVLGPITAAVLTGAFVVESIFSIPGMGKFFVMSLQHQDYPMIAGTTIFYGAFLILANLVVDLLYGIIDPRVKLAK